MTCSILTVPAWTTVVVTPADSTVQTLLWHTGHERDIARLWNYACTSLGSLPISPHCGPVLFHGSSSHSWEAFISLRKIRPSVVPCKDWNLSLYHLNDSLPYEEMPKKFCWPLVHSGEMFSLSTKMQISSASIWRSDHLYLPFCLFILVLFSQIPINNPNTQTDMNHLMCQACQTKFSLCAFQLFH